MFSADLDKCTYGDGVAFLEQRLPEGQRLDYKADWPKGVERTIAAMANTEGGLIILGVEPDGESRLPKSPPVGCASNQAAHRFQGLSSDLSFHNHSPDRDALSSRGQFESCGGRSSSALSLSSTRS